MSAVGFDRAKKWIEEGQILKSEGATSMVLFRALSSLCGVEGFAEGETHLMKEHIGTSDHYLFVLIDGMGWNQRSRWQDLPFLGQCPVREIRSVFPSTTAVALTSLASCRWPSEHGITGWFTYIPEYGKTVLPLPAVERSTQRAIADSGISFSEVVCVPSVLNEYQRRVTSLLPKKLVRQSYARWSRGQATGLAYRNTNNAFTKVLRRINRTRNPSFTYLYLSQVDHLSHLHGWDSPEVMLELQKIDLELDRLLHDLRPGVTIVITADHGHINIPKETHMELRDGDALSANFLLPPSGESRVPIFHIKPGREAAFLEEFTLQYGSTFELITPDEAEQLRLFGPDPLSTRMFSRLGNYIGITRGPNAIEYVPAGKEALPFVGMHGGMSSDEVEIPLFVTRT